MNQDFAPVQEFEEKQKPTVINPKIQKFIKNLSGIVSELSQNQDFEFKMEYGRRLPVARFDIETILNWIIDHPALIAVLSKNNPLRFQANSAPAFLPVTIHLIMNSSGEIQLIFDPNSKKSRVTPDKPAEKYPEVKDSEKPLKVIGAGCQKTVRYAWALDCESRSIIPIAASIYKGEEMMEKFYNTRDHLYPEGNPFLLNLQFGSVYTGHTSKDAKEPKAISFSPVCTGSWYDLADKMQDFKPDVADILWVYYSSIAALAEYHASGRIHRDVKLENFLFIKTPDGRILFFLNDFDLSILAKDADSTEGPVATLYYAFDRPRFRELILLHNELFWEIVLDEPDLLEIRKLKSRFQVLCDKYILEEANYSQAIKIISETKQDIPLTKPNHLKDDVWALCKAWKIFGDKISQYLQPKAKIFIELDNLAERNYLAIRDKRMTSMELLSELEALIGRILNEDVTDLIEKEDLELCRNKILGNMAILQKNSSQLFSSLEPLIKQLPIDSRTSFKSTSEDKQKDRIYSRSIPISEEQKIGEKNKFNQEESGIKINQSNNSHIIFGKSKNVPLKTTGSDENFGYSKSANSDMIHLLS